MCSHPESLCNHTNLLILAVLHGNCSLPPKTTWPPAPQDCNPFDEDWRCSIGQEAMLQIRWGKGTPPIPPKFLGSQACSEQRSALICFRRQPSSRLSPLVPQQAELVLVQALQPCGDHRPRCSLWPQYGVQWHLFQLLFCPLAKMRNYVQ